MIFSRKNTAFTLVELLIVVGIIALLAAIIVTNFSASRPGSRDSKRVSDITQLQLALELFFDRCGGYPQPVSGQVSLTSTIATCPSGITMNSFITTLPTPPQSDTYDYAVNANPATDYVLRATLETSSSALQNDIDVANLYGLNCQDISPNYHFCLGPK